VARDWHHLFLTDGAPALTEDAPDPGEGDRRRGFFGRLRDSMRKTREALAAWPGRSRRCRSRSWPPS